MHTAGVRVRKAFRYRLYPTPAQADRLAAWEHALRFLWNLAHEQRLMAHGRRCKVDARYPTAFDQINELTVLRAELPWLADVPRNVCAQVLCELDKAWQRCFKRLGRAPRWKRKGRDRAPLCEPHPKLFAVGAATITFPKLGAIPAVIHRPLVGTPKTCALVRDGDAWFASVVCESEIPDPLPSTKPAVAIDRGVVNLLADSDGRVLPNPRPFERIRTQLARAQRTVARRKKGSKNQQKARVRVARLQRKARRQRDAVLHRESHRYAQNHGAVIVERLDIRSMIASARGTTEQPGTNVRAKAGLNRAILDGGWGRFVEMLRYKVVPHGGAVVEVPAAYSSQTCAVCGVVDAASRRSQSEFECVACGHCANADVNAAKVLYTRGSHGGEGCGGDAVGRPAKQQLRVARRGTRSTGEAKASAFRPG
jgi:putative transposase